MQTPATEIDGFIHCIRKDVFRGDLLTTIYWIIDYILTDKLFLSKNAVALA
jgi:hypothetical protein